MKIKLKMNVPVAIRHKMLKGNEYDVIEVSTTSYRETLYKVMGADNEEVGVLRHECEEILEKEV